MTFLKLTVLFMSWCIIIALSEKCRTPNNEEAECISLYHCPVLIAALVVQDEASREFVRKSNCGGTASEPLVCCGSFSNFTLSQGNEPPQDSNRSLLSLLPSRSYCGYQHADDYIRDGNATSIDEFPWLAALVFAGNNKTQTLCSGSLINNKYVLTAAHCVNNTHTRQKLAGVRLGEHNVKTEQDCVGKDSDFYECSEPPQDFEIEKKIVHPGFDIRLRIHDVALLRLAKRVRYSDYIRPICLPTPGTKFAIVGDALTTSGWGLTTLHGQPAETKKKILLALISNEECSKAGAGYEMLTDNHFCTKDPDSNTEFLCRGDSGAPVMFSYKNQWHQEGISSFGKGCHEGFPDVHAKVVNYLKWIEENMEP